jgi:hypothetical protein
LWLVHRSFPASSDILPVSIDATEHQTLASIDTIQNQITDMLELIHLLDDNNANDRQASAKDTSTLAVRAVALAIKLGHKQPVPESQHQQQHQAPNGNEKDADTNVHSGSASGKETAEVHPASWWPVLASISATMMVLSFSIVSIMIFSSNRTIEQ